MRRALHTSAITELKRQKELAGRARGGGAMTKAGGGSECEILISSTLRRAEHIPTPLPFPCQVNELSHKAGGGKTGDP